MIKTYVSQSIITASYLALEVARRGALEDKGVRRATAGGEPPAHLSSSVLGR